MLRTHRLADAQRITFALSGELNGDEPAELVNCPQYIRRWTAEGAKESTNE